MQKQICCPYCGQETQVDVDLRIFESGDDQIRIAIFKAIQAFLFWNLYGKPEYGKDQNFYDPYHSSVKFQHDGKESGRFEFFIQISDSPDRDWWIRGSVEIRGCRIDWDTLVVEHVAG